MRIALIGNMNNNNFSLMRYFCDLGVDAHLITYANDGIGSLSHFRPEDDSWEIEKWKQRIHQSQFMSGHPAIVGHPKKLSLPPSRKHFDEVFSKYTAFIGTGVAPAIFKRFGRMLDVYFPHSSRVEFLGSFEYRNALQNSDWLRRTMYRYLSQMQLGGLLQNTKTVVCSDNETAAFLAGLGVKSIKAAMPMVYVESQNSYQGPASSEITGVLERMQAYDFIVTSHASQYWVKPETLSDEQFNCWNKNNNWTIEAFAKLLRIRPGVRSLLVLFEYGNSVRAAKELCQGLGIEENVIWLPKLPRKMIMQILAHSTIGVGEFTQEKSKLWGGTGWEVLASGKPLLQDFRFEEGEFERVYGYPPPPMLPVADKADILNNLLFVLDHPQKMAEMGRGALEWFNRNNGIALAKKWLEYINASPGENSLEMSENN